MHILIGIIGVIFLLALAFLFSLDRKNIRWKYVGILLAIQLIFAFILLKTTMGIKVIDGISNGFNYLLLKATDDVNFVFSSIQCIGPRQSPLFSSILLPIVFISAVIGILQCIKVLPLVINVLGFLIPKVNDMERLGSYNTVAAAILGQSEVFIPTKEQLPYIPKQRLYTLTASAVSAVSASVIDVYFTLIEPKCAVTTVALSLFGGFIIAPIINPYKVNEEGDKLLVEETEERQQSFFEVLGEYILDEFKVAIIVGAMLVGCIAIIALLNGIVSNIFSTISGGAISWDFQTLTGFVFVPSAFLVGVPWQDAVQADSVMATELLSNEFITMQALGELSDLPEHAKGIAPVSLVSFTNFDSVGIISSATKSLNDKKGDTAARFGSKLLFGATLVSFISAAIAGFFI